MEILIFDTHRQLSAIISPYKSVWHHFSEGRLFSSEKNLWRSVLEVNKKQVFLKSYYLKITIDSVNQILKKKEKVTQTPGPNTGCFSRRWPLLGARKSAPKKNNFFFQDKLYYLKAHTHYLAVFIYLETWRAAKLGIFTHFTFTNLPQSSMNLLIHVCSIQIPSCF